MNLEESVERTISRQGLIDRGEKVLVGVSGGMDSTALLYCLHRLKDRLSVDLGVAHVNHQLRGAESERDEAFVRNLAAGFSLPFYLRRENVKDYSRKAGKSLQHAGRDVRYAFFAEIARSEGYGKIAIAHNGDDQVETFLLRVIKGTGINGLSAIPVRRGPIIRPFLGLYRSEITAYATEHCIDHVEDSSNRKVTYERNFLRHRVTPLLEQINPRFREKIVLLLSDITSIDNGFDREAEEFIAAHVVESGVTVSLPLASFKVLHQETRFRVVSRLLAYLEPQYIALREHVGLVERSLFSSRPNTSVKLPHDIRALKAYDQATFTKKTSAPTVDDVFNLEIGFNHVPDLGVDLDISVHDELPEGFGQDTKTAVLDADLVGPLTLRTFRNGDRFSPLGMTAQVKLKDYFMSRKIPRERRRRVPLLLSAGEIAWVVGERINNRFKTGPETRRFLRVAARFHATD